MTSELMNYLEAYADGAVICHGFDNCIIGIAYPLTGPVLVYDKAAMLEQLMTQQNMTDEEAVEWLEYNVLNNHGKEGRPIYMERLLL